MIARGKVQLSYSAACVRRTIGLTLHRHAHSSRARMVGQGVAAARTVDARALAAELGSQGVTVNAISPGLTRHPGSAAHLPAQAFEAVRARQFIPRTEERASFPIFRHNGRYAEMVALQEGVAD